MCLAGWITTVAAVLAAVFSAYEVLVRWPSLSIDVHPGAGTGYRDSEPIVLVGFELVNRGSRKARDVRIVAYLDDEPITERTQIVVPGDGEYRGSIELRHPDQAELEPPSDLQPGDALNLHGRRLSACVFYRRAGFLWVTKRCAAHPSQ